MSNNLQGNKFVLSSNFPTVAGQTATFDLGWYVAWDSTQGNADHSFYALLSWPKHAAVGHTWTWDVTINGEYHSNP